MALWATTQSTGVTLWGFSQQRAKRLGKRWLTPSETVALPQVL
jgi:hypothetical protein